MLFSAIFTNIFRPILMKKSLLILLLLTICGSFLFSQITEGDEGVYYDANGKTFTGIHKEYWENGNVKIEMPLKKGIKDGETYLYFENGTKNEVRAYKKGKMHGTWVTWDEKGNKIAEANYMKGKKHGKWFVWDENGTLRYDMTYKKGEKTGKWMMWDEKGKLIMEKEHE
jgi:antitoxin component YwqK of YwqJK toxin-antitoxin module